MTNHKSAQKAGEVFILPATGPAVAREGFFATIKFRGVDAATTGRIPFLRHDGVEHFVIKHVFEKPARNKWLIEQGMNPNDTIFLLDRSEDEIFFRPLLPSPAPKDFVTAQPAAKMTVVHALENVAQIEMATFMPKIKLALHRQRRPGQFSFRFFRHRTFRITEGNGHKFRFCFAD